MTDETNKDGPILLVKGVKGFLEGEEREIGVGDALVVGRSRNADFSVRRAKKLVERSDAADVMETEAFLSVSRKHVRIHYMHPDLIEIKDLSSNGTFLDGRKVDCVAVTDLKQRSHILALGAVERLSIEFPEYKELGVETEVTPES
jgi:hypothetical protein